MIILFFFFNLDFVVINETYCMKRQLLIIINKGPWRQKKNNPVSILNCRDLTKTLISVSDKVYKSLNIFIFRK